MSELLEKLKAPFDPARVHFRVGAMTQDKKKGIGLAYIDARDVMERLDAVVGPENWQCTYPHASNKTVCAISLKIDGEWVFKSNGAGDTDIEGAKGALSNAFKRAAVCWGIGRYLYDMPDIWVELDDRKRFTDKALTRLRNELKALSETVVLPTDPTQVKKSSAQAKRDGDYERLKGDMLSQEKPDHLKAWAESAKEELAHLPEKWADILREEYISHMQTLEQLMEPV